MIGSNKMEWNQAMMKAAVQHYLDTVVLKDPGSVKVIAVKHGVHEFADFGIFTDEPKASV